MAKKFGGQIPQGFEEIISEYLLKCYSVVEINGSPSSVAEVEPVMRT